MYRKKTYKKYGGNTPDQFYTPRSVPSLLRHSSNDSSVSSYMSAEDGEDECPICLENLRYYSNGRYLPSRSLYTTRCNHNYHFDCAKRHFMNNTRCPLCRTEINDFIERPAIQQNIDYDMDDIERRLQILMNDAIRNDNEEIILQNQINELNRAYDPNNITDEQIRLYEQRLEELDNNQIDYEDAF